MKAFDPIHEEVRRKGRSKLTMKGIAAYRKEERLEAQEQRTR